MKSSWLTGFCLAGALLCSCGEKPEEHPPLAEVHYFGPAGMQVRLGAEGPLSVYQWKAGDALRINGEVFTLASGAGEKAASFNGKVLDDRFFTVTMPSGITDIESYLTFSFQGQEQDGNGSAAHLKNTVLMEDVTTYDDMTLSAEWAAAKGGRFRSSGVLAFDLALPAEAGALESVTVESAGVRFPLDNAGRTVTQSLILSLKNVKPGSAPLQAFLAVPEKILEIAEGSGVKITVAGEQSYSITLPMALKLGGGLLAEIKVADASAWTGFSVVRGEGTEASPYILMTPEDLVQMRELLVPGATTWFEMGADIDMSGILNWVPLNTADPFDMAVHFDGKGHTLKNFSCADKKYSSFFGVLVGYCGNVTFDGAVSKHTTPDGAYSPGIVGGFAGTTAGATATVENVHVKNALVSSEATPATAFALGGLFANAAYATIRGCSFDGKIDNQVYGTGTNPDRAATGGIVGKLNAGSTVENCTSAGEIIGGKSRYTGGIAGWVVPDEDITIRGCTNTAAVTGGADRAAGIAGHFQQGIVENCVNKGTITSGLVGSVSGSGGIVGYSGVIRISGCVNEGSVTGSKNAVGGIIGYAERAAIIERCSSTGEIRSTGGRYIGGIAGGLKVANSSITDCWTSGAVVGEKDQEAGGIVGSVMTGQTVSCCYSTAVVESARVAGGIVARACNNGWTYTGSFNNTVEKCIAWNPSVTATAAGDVNTLGGSGVVVGFTSFYNTLTACWRRADLVFTASDTVNNVAVDQPDCSPSSPYVMGTTPGTAGKYGCPYHGKAAPSGATVSSLALDLGWNTSVWDLSGDYPVLK